MRKTFWITAVLLASLGLAVGQTAQAPRIVAKGKFIGRKGNLAQTIFTPTQAGIYRVSTYFVLTTPDSSSGGQWALTVNWTDEVGQEAGGFVSILDSSTPPNASRSGSVVIEAIAGTPVLVETGHTAPDNSVYSLYYVVETLAVLP